MCRLLVSGGLVVAGRDALRGDVQVPAVRYPFGHDAQRSPVDDVELYGGNADSAKMFGTAERPVPEGKTRIVCTSAEHQVRINPYPN